MPKEYYLQTDVNSDDNSGVESDALSVTDALNIAKRQLERDTFSIIGEVSELSDKPGYKAVYFTISDENSALSCMMWKNVYAAQDVEIELGQSIEIRGNFTIYTAKGRMNFVAKKIELAGEGYLRMKVAKLAKKLKAEGLMDASRKREIPILPEKIAIVTSPRGKAIHDVMRTLKRRAPYIELLVTGVAVEGATAPEQIINGLHAANAAEPDIILLVRGGGSHEDLMPFNDEALARVIADSKTPIITGIGHEPDNSIADMVSDFRASTPTAAAEAASLDRGELAQNLSNIAQKLNSRLIYNLESMKSILKSISSRRVLSDPRMVLTPFALRLDANSENLVKAIPKAMYVRAEFLDSYKQRLIALPNIFLERFDTKLVLAASKMEAMSPLSVLARGYSIAFDSSGRVLRTAGNSKSGDKIKLKLEDGTLDCSVL